MKKRYLLCAALALLVSCNGFEGKNDGPELREGAWKGALHRPDGKDIVFNFEVKDSADKKVLYIINAAERMLVDSIRLQGDSVFIHMPFFASDFWARFQNDGSLKGAWVRRRAGEELSIPFTARPNTPERFEVKNSPEYDVSGRWAVNFMDTEGNDTTRAVGEFYQSENKVTGTFLTTTGDYRYLQGVVDGDTLRLSAFDGSNAHLFIAHITDSLTIDGGDLYYGAQSHAIWTARKDSAAHLPDAFAITTIKRGEDRLSFSFPDMNGKMVSLQDERYKGKVVLVQILGSWCPNCMDETRFLSDYYKKNKSRGLEIIGLCYERTPDFKQSVQSVESFKKRFDVQYELLMTGVTPGDPKLVDKTLPQLQHFISFPTTIFLDKKGRVRKIHAGFSGPGTGSHYQEFINEFNQIVNGLLAEQG